MKRGKSAVRRRGATALTLAAGAMVARCSIAAADDSWIAGTGNWNAPVNWDQNRVPNSGDNVFILHNDAPNRTIALDVSTTFLTLQLGNSGGGNDTLTLVTSTAVLTATGSAFVGGSDLISTGAGTLNITSGTMNVAGILKVWNASSIVNLSGGTLSASSLDLGGSASRFHQTGGTFSQTGSGSFLPTSVPTGGGLNLSPTSADATMTGPAGGLTNNGNIIFDAPTGSYNTTFAGNITNIAGKAVRVRGGGGGARVIAGNLDNFGAIAFNNADATPLNVSSLNMESGSQDFPSIGPPGVANTINITNSGGLTLSSSATTVGINFGSARNVGPSGFGVGTYTLFHYTGTLNGSINGFFKQSGTSNLSYTFVNDAANGNINVDIVPATGVSWTDTGADGKWNTGSNWSGSVAPTSTQLATFPTPVPIGQATVTLAAGELANGLRFNDNYTLTGGSLALASGLINVAAGKTVTIASSLNAQAVFGSMGLVKAGLGSLVLTGSNTYNGTTVANSGTLTAGAANTFPAGGTYSTPVGPVTTGGTLQASGGTLDTGGLNQSVATVILSAGNININAGTVNASNGVLVNAAAGAGSINLHGGMLSTPSYATNTNHASLNWTGGTLQLTGTGTVPVATIPAGTTLSLAPSASNIVITGQSLGTSGPAKPPVISIASPNFSSNRSGAAIDAIVIHTTEESYAATISQFQTPGQDSANYVNNSDGTITEMVDPASGHAAFHATYYNDRSIGIENVGFSDQAGTWNSQNIASLENLVAYLAYTYNVPVLRPTDNAQYNILQSQTTTGGTLNEPGIVAHAQIQPWDRYDPGQYFPWATFVADVQNLIANSIAAAPITNNGTINVTNTGSHTVTYRGDINNVGALNITSTRFTENGNITNPGSITLNGGAPFASFAALTLTGSGSVSLAPGSSAMLRAQQVSITGGTAKIDLADNKMIVTGAGSTGSWNGSAYTGGTGLIASGRNGNATPLWDGASGIVTSQTVAKQGNYTTLGVARASDVLPATVSTTALWGGQTITGTDTLVMYTYGGDANLDGKINIDDYVKIDTGIASGLTGWANGDFNYDGKVNIDDYTTVIDANIGNQGGVFPTAGGADVVPSGASAVPEPAGAAIVFLGIVGNSIAGRSRRRRYLFI